MMFLLLVTGRLLALWLGVVANTLLAVLFRVVVGVVVVANTLLAVLMLTLLGVVVGRLLAVKGVTALLLTR